MSHPSKLVQLLEKEIAEFCEWNNVRKILSKYGASVPDYQLEKAVVILGTEMRQRVEKWRADLPEDEAEAMAAVGRKKGRRGPNKADGGSSKEPLEVFDEDELIEL
jgi:hypothetical protein